MLKVQFYNICISASAYPTTLKLLPTCLPSGDPSLKKMEIINKVPLKPESASTKANQQFSTWR